MFTYIIFAGLLLFHGHVSAASETRVQVPEKSAMNLKASLMLSNTTISVGQRFKIMVEIENSGIVECSELLLQDLVWSGEARFRSIREPGEKGPFRLRAGSRRAFEWEYSAVGRGLARFTARMSAQDGVSGLKIRIRPRLRQPLLVQDPARLTAAVAVEPAEICSGQEFAVILKLANEGEANAARVAPAAPRLSGTGSALPLKEGYSVEPKSVAGGKACSWRWTFKGGAVGTLSLSITASGVDGNSGAPVLPTPAVSASVTVLAPGALAVEIGAPSTVSVGQQGWVYLTVSNTGGASVSELSPDVRIESGKANLTAGPFARKERALPPGAVGTFRWRYSIEEAGTVGLRGGIRGLACGGAPISATCVSFMAAQRPAALTGALGVSATTVVIGQPVIVALTVTDGGEAIARGVRPELMECLGPAVRISPHPFGFRSLGAGEGTSYRWTYSPSGAGEVLWSVRARGIDGNSGMPIMTDWFKTPPVRILAPADVSIKSLRLLPGGSVEQEAFVQAFLVIGNDGQADAEIAKVTIKELVPEAFKKKHSKAKPTLTGWFAPNATFPLVVPGRKVVVIMWTYRAINTGPTYVTASAEGSESLTGRAIKLPVTASNEVVVEEPPKEEEEEN